MVSSKPYFTLALDPGAVIAGIAFADERGYFEGVDFVKLLDFSTCPLYQRVKETVGETGKILLISEYPTAGTPNGPQVRQAANIAIARVKLDFPRRCKVVKVVPQTWQSRVTKGCPGANPKERSAMRASIDYPFGHEWLRKNFDMADALNILTYAKGYVTWADGR